MANGGHLIFCFMGWKTIIINEECKISLNYNSMRVHVDGEYINVPISDIDTVIFSHEKMILTIPILSKLVEHNVNVLICNDKNDPIGVFNPFNNHSLSFKQLNKQINWKITRKKKLWKKIVEDKIQTEIDALLLLDITDQIYTLKQYQESVYNDDQTNREAASAKLYFNLLFGSDFKRDDESEINYALNYGYKIIASYITKCIASRGLLSQLGIHHIGESNPFNLTYDFIETFRCIIDIWVYENVINKFTIQQKHELIDILNCKVKINNKWIRLNDGIEDIIDSYIGFLNDKTEDILSLDLSVGIKKDEC